MNLTLVGNEISSEEVSNKMTEMLTVEVYLRRISEKPSLISDARDLLTVERLTQGCTCEACEHVEQYQKKQARIYLLIAKKLKSLHGREGVILKTYYEQQMTPEEVCKRFGLANNNLFHLRQQFTLELAEKLW